MATFNKLRGHEDEELANNEMLVNKKQVLLKSPGPASAMSPAKVSEPSV